MCFKKIASWFNKPDPIPDPIPDPTGKKKIALLFAINNYPGTQNDLNGCINDQVDVIKTLNSKFPGFDIRNYTDIIVTRSNFITVITEAIGELQAGDLLLVHYSGHGTQIIDEHGDEADGYDEAVYLYDGLVIDDDIGDSLKSIPDGATVVLMFDSCFSGTVTRKVNLEKNRFVPNPYISRKTRQNLKKRTRFSKAEMKWIVFSGCGEQQTSADAYIDGRYNGAFTYYALKTLKPGITYKEWIEQINTYLPSGKYDQAPTLEGNELLFNQIVFT